jgi:alkylation response protein AidB-like acyl-CoA dehydrogenase
VLVAEEVGRALAPVPFASSVYLATEALQLAGTPEQKKTYLPELAAGERIGTLTLVEGPGQPTPSSIKTTFEKGRLNGSKFGVPDGNIANLAVVVAQSSAGPTLALVDLGGQGVQRKALASIDPTQSSAAITFQDAVAEPLGSPGEGWTLAERLFDRAAVLLAFEQLGGAQRALEITREYMMERFAFGRPIASFQALKHRMSEMYCAIELARSNNYYGAWALSTDAEELGIAACNARVSTAQAAELVTMEMIQLHGGVGFTWEYDCHLFYRRAKHQSALLGPATHWRDKLIERLLAKRAA